MSRVIWGRKGLADALAAAASTRLTDEPVRAIGAGWTDVGVQPDWGLGWWIFALPLTWLQRRRRLSALSGSLGWRAPRRVGLVVTSERAMIYDRRLFRAPVLAAEFPVTEVRDVRRPTVGGYVRTLQLDLSEGRSLTLRLLGDGADAVAGALRGTMTAA